MGPVVAMDRRAFLTALAGGVLHAPLAAAQPAAKVPRVGILANGSAGASPALDALRQALRDLGHVEGQNVAVQVQWAEGRFERMPALAAELVAWNPTVLVTAGPYGLQAARRATATIPIVMISCDPAETIVERIARPAGHITGVTCMSADLTPKRLQLLKDAVPSTQRVAVLYNPVDPNTADEVRRMQDPARTLGITIVPFEASAPDAFEGALRAVIRAQAEALIVLPDPVTLQERRRIADLAATHRLPAMYGFREFVTAGGLMSYGTMQTDLYRRAAAHVDKLLRGRAPVDVPVEQATRFELVVNLKAARGLGLVLPPSLLLRADDVIDP
jgi:putative ABC transport system substrate-binding protein